MSVEPLKSNALPLDRVHLSTASHGLVDGTNEANRVPEGAVSPERMLEVLRRLDQGHYSSPEVQDKVAQAVLQDLGLSRTE
jgi:hypothetical protein